MIQASIYLDYKQTVITERRQAEELKEGQLQHLRQENARLKGALALANKSITEAQDDETPAPVLHMMNRLEEAETTLKALQERILRDVVRDPDYVAIAQLGYQEHMRTCPSRRFQKSHADIADGIRDEVANTCDLCDTDYLEDEIDNATQMAEERGEEALEAQKLLYEQQIKTILELRAAPPQ